MLELVVDNGSLPPVTGQRRARLARVTGVRSAKECNDRQLRAVLSEFERMGWKPTATARHRSGGGETIRKARAMWISLYQLGAIADGSDKALDAFGRRQLSIARLEWSEERSNYRLIEALKAIAARHGWDQRLPPKLSSSERRRMLADRLVGAQLAKLEASGMPVAASFAANRSNWTISQLERASNALGAALRSAFPAQ